MPGLRSAPDAVHTLRLGRGRARLGPWSADPGVARLVIAPDAPLDAVDVRRCMERARMLGFRGLVTNALSQVEATPFLTCDFTVHERLHLLGADLLVAPAAPAVPVTHVRRREYDDVIGLDEAAFPRDWRLGRSGLTDALGATPSRQFRATRHDDAITGYAITGLAGRCGYLQRIATARQCRRAGLGRALVADAFAYLWGRGAQRVFVNTQLDNAPALALYESCGFELFPSGLTVLECSW